jgi:hypothetical protein
VVRRRLDVRGGLDKRYMTVGQYWTRLHGFVWNVVRRHHPVRVRALYPLYVLVLWGWTVDWIWNDSNRYRTTPSRLAATAGSLLALPVHVARALSAAR